MINLEYQWKTVINGGYVIMEQYKQEFIEFMSA